MKSIATVLCIAAHGIAAQFSMPSLSALNNGLTSVPQPNNQDASVHALSLYLSHLFHHHDPPMYHQQIAAAALQQQAQQQQKLQQLGAQIVNYVNAQNQAQDAEANKYHESVLQILVRIVHTVDADHTQIGKLSQVLDRIIGDMQRPEPVPAPAVSDCVHNFLHQQAQQLSDPADCDYLINWLAHHRLHQPEDADKVESLVAQILKLHVF